MKKLFTTLAVFASVLLIGQQTVKLKIDHKLGAANFGFGQTSSNNLNNSFNLTRVQYYLSDLVIIHDGAQTTNATGVYALVDAAAPTTIDLGTYPGITTIEGIKFSVGVNNPENGQDPSLWPATHALSPKSPSMHWGWASGYFFIVYEGNSSPSLNQTLGLSCLGSTTTANANYFSQTIMSAGAVIGGEQVIRIKADYAMGLKDIDISNGLILHSSSGENSTLAANFRDNVFSAVVATVSTVGVKEEAASSAELSLYPNPSSTGVFLIEVDKMENMAGHLVVSDIAGRIISTQEITEASTREVSINEKGIYFANLIVDGKTVSTQKLIVY